MSIILFIIVIALLAMIISSTVRIVPQAHAYVVERLGAYQGTWSVGLHVKVPFIDRVARKVNLKEQVFSPLGLGDWRIVTSLISGFMAKESVVSTLGVLFNGNITAAITPLAASSLLVFSLLYSPCVAAIASVKRELGTRWAVGLALWQCMIAWIAALIVRFIGLII